MSKKPFKKRPPNKKNSPQKAKFDSTVPAYDMKKIKAVEKKVGEEDSNEGIRLNKYIANSGICSRREADTHIAEGKVTVNSKVIKEMGYKVQPTDIVSFEGKVIKREKLVYVLLNKPKGFITTMDDPKDRKTVMDLVKKACDERIYPVGRLDRNTTGLLLFTNDGVLAKRLTHPSHKVRKIYQVELDKPITEEHFLQIEAGLELEDGHAPVEKIAILNPEGTRIGVEIVIGRNRIVRRIFGHLGYEVVKLDRTVYASLTKKDLPRGKWRYLAEKEVIRLKHF
jgi:23S rRNA pseudouridine2605 synthase